MSGQAQTHNTNCDKDYHDEHLCYLMYMGVHLEDKPGYKKLVQNAQFRCDRCGRTTESDRNLCEPVSL